MWAYTMSLSLVKGTFSKMQKQILREEDEVKDSIHVLIFEE